MRCWPRERHRKMDTSKGNSSDASKDIAMHGAGDEATNDIVEAVRQEDRKQLKERLNKGHAKKPKKKWWRDGG